MRIILDCDLMRHRNSGLYHYCLNLGTYVRKILDQEHKGEMKFYVPPSEHTAFSDNEACIIERKWHVRYVRPFLLNCDVWHAPFQTGRLIPQPKNRIKILLTIHDLNVLHEDKPQKEKIESLKKTQKLINNSDAVVCISNHTKKDVLENLNVDGKPVHVIHNGTHYVNTAPLYPPAYKPR